MGILQDVWAIERDVLLTDGERNDMLATAKAPAWLALSLPIVADGFTLTSCQIDGRTVRFEGSGRSLVWPLELVGHPVGVRDPAGSEIDPDGIAWRLDPLTILLTLLADL